MGGHDIPDMFREKPPDEVMRSLGTAPSGLSEEEASPFKFPITDAFSALITIAITAVAGYAGGSGINTLRKDLTRVEHIGVLLAILLFICYLIYRNVKARSDARR